VDIHDEKEPPMKTALALIALALVASACDTAASPSRAASAPASSEDPYRVTIDPEPFVDVVDNPYFPLVPGTRWRLEGETDEGQEVDEITVTDRTKEVMGVTTTVVKDVVTINGELAEKTFDWYAQDVDGNVWYFGEDTTEFENGEPAGHAGAWEAGVDGALPGILLPAEPEVGMTYRQEYYAGEAEDRAEVLSLDAAVSVPFGDFTGAVQTEDTTPLEPEIVEQKFYVREIGPVLALKVKGDTGREELVSHTRG
jgi:hypothetical protein